jgi:hypothetical protein
LYLIKQSSAAKPLLFFMRDSGDHISGKTGLSPTVTISKNGGGFSSPSGAVTEIANGWYKVAGNATDTSAEGPLVLHATGTGADPTDAVYNVVSFGTGDGLPTVQDVARIVFRADNVHFVSKNGNTSNDGLSPTAAKALPTQPSPAAGDAVVVFAGDYNIAGTVIGAAATYVRYTTPALGMVKVRSSAELGVWGPVLYTGTGSVFEDFHVQLTASSGKYQASHGFDAIVSAASETSYVRGLMLDGADTDSGYVNTLGAAATINWSNLWTQTKWDNAAINMTGGKALIQNWHMTAAGPSTIPHPISGDPIGDAIGLKLVGDSNGYWLDNVHVVARDPAADECYGLLVQGTNHFVQAVNSTFDAKSSDDADTVADVRSNATSNVVRAFSSRFRSVTGTGSEEVYDDNNSPAGEDTAGPGADHCTLTFTNTTTALPIADADVWITTDLAGENVVAGTLQTNSSGEATFLLDEGETYYSWLQKGGVNSIRGQSFVAEADE